MRESTIARNYAEALFEAAEQTGDTELFADLIESVGGAIEADEHIRIVLDSPRVTKSRKQSLLASALRGRAPESFIRFLNAVLKRGRQAVIGQIAREYLALVDVKMNRVHANVTVARMPDQALQQTIKARLSQTFGLDVIPHYRQNAAIIGGVIVRVGDRVMDGSIRRRLLRLRKAMLGT